MKLKIGLFDSGLGGLTILKHLQVNFPEVDFVFVADYAYNPYGTKDFSIIEERVSKIGEFLKETCNIIIIACNTASIHKNVLGHDKHIIDVILPTCSYATNRAKEKLGVLATDKTIESGAYQSLIKKSGLAPYAVKASSFVDIIEGDKIETQNADKIFKEKLDVFIKEDVNTVILGCTHFELIEPKLKVLAPAIDFIVSSIPIANAIRDRYITKSGIQGNTHIYFTQENEHFMRMIKNLSVEFEKLELLSL